MPARRHVHILLQLVVSVAFAFAGRSTWGATCTTQFVDIPPDASYCQAAQWVASRSISIGCTDSTHYCPNDAVTRASMALFLNRTAVAIAPTFLHVAATSFNVAAGGSIECMTNPFDVAGYNRVLTAEGMFSLGKTASSTSASGFLVYSIDGGTTWTDMAQVGALVNVVAGTYVSGNSVSDVVYIAPGASLVVGLEIFPTTGADVNGNCEVRARLENYNGRVLQ